MSAEITNKTRVVVTKLGDFWVTPEQGQAIMEIKENDPSASIELEDNQIACHTIDGVLTPDAYGKLNYKRRGGWQCKYGEWHERHQQCAHGQGLR